jgi:hypothetical protein
MTGHNLPENYIDNLEALLRKNKSRASSSFATPLVVEPVTSAPSATIVMAKSLCNYSTPAVPNVPVGLTINTGTENFKL